MSKKAIQQRFKNEYLERIRTHLHELKRQGYVLADDKVFEHVYLMRFDVYKFRFEIVSSLGEAHKHIRLQEVSNPFKIVLDDWEVIEIIADTFKPAMVDSDDLYLWCCYEEDTDELLPADELKADLKNYLQISKSLAGTLDTNIDTPQGQGQILAGANVFYTSKENMLTVTETNKYYQWNTKTKMFKRISATDIQKILRDVAGVEVKKLEVETNMRTVYPLIVPTASFPVIWNKQKDLQEKLKRNKKAHDKINKIIKNFE